MSLRWWFVGTALFVACANAWAGSGTALFFHEDFAGTELDTAKWRTAIATAGARWCDPNPGRMAGPGRWLDPSQETCYGALGPGPYGAITLSGGVASFSATPGARGFAYVWTGPPHPGSPFPATRGFTFRVRLRYDALGACGTGVSVQEMDDATPAGTNPPEKQLVLGVWADGTRAYMKAVGFYPIPVSIPNPTAWHEYAVTL